MPIEHGGEFLGRTIRVREEGLRLKKEALLKNIAEAGYNIGFGGKKHFVTYDLYRIFPRLISSVVICIGILQLTNLYRGHVSTNVGDVLSATLIIFGIIGLVLDFQGENKEAYEKSGKKLLGLFNELRGMYHQVKVMEEQAGLTIFEDRLKEIQKEADDAAISKQAIGTHIITHFGFFKVMQSTWVVKELNLTKKDKFPFWHWESFFLYIIGFVLLTVILQRLT